MGRRRIYSAGPASLRAEICSGRHPDDSEVLIRCGIAHSGVPTTSLRQTTLSVSHRWSERRLGNGRTPSPGARIAWGNG